MIQLSSDISMLRNLVTGKTGLRAEAILRVCKVAEEADADGYVCGGIAGVGIFKGGCGQHVSKGEAYRCSDCTASFHRDCIRQHFKEDHHEG